MNAAFSSFLLLLIASSARGGVTYVDATLANTDNAAGGGDETWADGNDGTTGGSFSDGAAVNDGLWRYRAGLGNGGIWEATGSSASAEDCREIVTSAAVPNETYDVYVFYYAVTGSGDFPVRAGFASDPGGGALFTRISGADAAGLDFEVAPPTGDETRSLLYGLVGQVEVNDGTLEVYIDDFPASATGSSNDRTWYAGIGYEVATAPPSPAIPDQVRGTLISLDPDAAWTWYTDERAIIDFPRLIIGGVRGKDWFGSVGDIVGTQYDLTTGRREPFLLGPPPIKDPSNIGSGDTAEDKDDHNTAAFVELPDGHYLAAWSAHSENNEIYLRRSSNPGDATSWEETQIYERSVADGASGPNDVTYNDLIFLSGEGTGQGRLYNFFRNDLADSWDRWFIYSDDLGLTWNWGGRHTGENDASIRPYPKYVSNGVDTIWWISSETNSGESIWSGYLKNGRNHKMDGQVIDADIFDNTAPAVAAYTAVMLTGEPDAGVPMENLWPRDLAYDSEGRLAALWRGYGNGSSTDIRQFYGLWDAANSAWEVHRMGYTGDARVTLQQDGTEAHRGTPLSAINPRNVEVCFLSANVDPATNLPLFSQADGRRNYEIFRAETADEGATWTYTQITRDSTCHNFRLSVVPWDGDNTAVVWMRGYYDRWYFNADNDGWDCAMVAWLDRPGESVEPFLSYIDADLSNTTLADGTALISNTSGAGAGADDDRWHFRTDPDFGNNGTLFTANESSPNDEDCPLLKTTISGVGPGTYEVHVCFWSPRANDYDVMAGLSETSLMYFERQSSQHASAAEFGALVRDTDASRHLYRAYVGRVTLASQGEVEVFVDQFANGGNSDNRTWYDGIALQQVGRADTDSDGDGQSDAKELIAGTDLYDSKSNFALESVRVSEGGAIELKVAGRTGRRYQFWRSIDLVTWTPISGVVDPLSNDAVVTVTDSSPPVERAFYRATVSLP